MPPVSLATTTKGTRGSVAGLETLNQRKLHKLMTMGILPGARVEVIQKFPAFVLNIGHTQVAIDEELARDILILPGW